LKIFFCVVAMSRKKLTPSQREAIVRGLRQGIKSKEIEKMFNVKRTTIAMCMKIYGNRTTFTDSPRSGRPRSTTRREDRAIKLASIRESKKTAVEIKTEMEEFGVTVCTTTVRSRLRGFGLFGRKPAKKPFVSYKNRKDRIKFAKDHLCWSVEDWGKVLFSDESKFLMMDNKVQYFRRRVGERFEKKILK